MRMFDICKMYSLIFSIIETLFIFSLRTIIMLAVNNLHKFVLDNFLRDHFFLSPIQQMIMFRTHANSHISKTGISSAPNGLANCCPIVFDVSFRENWISYFIYLFVSWKVMRMTATKWKKKIHHIFLRRQ